MTIAQWIHLFPSRTQKLSTVVAKVAFRGKNSELPGFFYLFVTSYLFFTQFIIGFIASAVGPIFILDPS